MKTNWDYSTLADAYLKRPDYSTNAVDAMVAIARLADNSVVCDVGAGVAHLTIMLAQYGFNVDAVEPNDNMRKNGIERTGGFSNISWSEGTGETTGRPSKAYDLVTFGSSFNVCDREKALVEVSRICKNRGWFACMWNHRDLEDPIQDKIENIIKAHIPSYGYGSRRQDQTEVIQKSELFGDVIRLNSSVVHKQSKEECVEAWRSHATLERQAGDKFSTIVSKISDFVHACDDDEITVPYRTHIWMARLKV